MATKADPKLAERAEWWDSLSAGLTNEEIAVKFGVTVDDAKTARDRVHSSEILLLAQPVADQFAHYRTRMEGVVRRLDRIHSEAMRGGKGRKVQLKTATDAARAMASIIDRTIDRGQELGVLPRASQQKTTRVQVSGGVMVGAMTADELSTRIKELAQEGRRLRADYEEGTPFTKLPQPDIYDNQPIEAEEPEPVRVNRRKV